MLQDIKQEADVYILPNTAVQYVSESTSQSTVLDVIVNNVRADMKCFISCLFVRDWIYLQQAFLATEQVIITTAPDWKIAH